jgi:hypothetical protein
MTIKESGQVLPLPIECLPHDNLDGHPWVAHTLSQCRFVKWGKVSSNSVAVKATKFVGPHKSCMRKYIINACCNMAQPMRSLVDTGEGYNHQSSEHENRPLSPFPSGILHFVVVAPPSLKLCHILKVKTINHIGPPSIERALSREASNHSSSPDRLHY